MKPTATDYANAVGALGVLKYFPSGADNREMIMVLLQNICDRKDRLAWLVNTLLNHVGEWPGPAQLRAIYAVRFRPADGVEGPTCTIGGFTPGDCERENLEGHKQLSDGESQKIINGLMQ